MKELRSFSHDSPKTRWAVVIRERPLWARGGVAAFCVLGAFALEELLGPVHGQKLLLTPFVAAILIAAWYGGLASGVAALIGSYVLADYFLIPPLHGLGAYSATDFLVMGVFTFTAVLGLLVVEASRRGEWRAQAALRQGEERLGRMLESVKDYAIFSLNEQGNIATWSEGAKRIFGFAREEVLGRSVNVIYSEEEREAGIWKEDMATAAKYGFARTERWHVRKDGKLFFLSGMIWPMRDNSGQLLGYTKIARDETERALHQEGLRQSEERYRALADATFDAVLIHENGIAIEVNESFCKLLGYGRNELTGEYVPDLLVAPQSRELVLEQVRSGSTERYEAVLQKRNGTEFLAEIRARNLTYHGRSVRVVSAHDITERKRAEEALRRSERRAKAQYKGFPVPTYTWQKLSQGDFILVDFNQAAEAFTHGHIADFIGKKANEMFPDVPEIINEISQCAHEKESIHREMFYRLRSTGESKHLAVTYVPVPPDLVMIHCEDITARKKHEEEIRQRTSKQEAVAELSHRALVETELQALFEKTVDVVSTALHTELSKIMTLCPDGKSLLLRAGVGWKEGSVGRATVTADRDSQPGYTLWASKRAVNGDLVTYEPVIVEDIRAETRFGATQLFLDHAVVSGMCVIIHGVEGPFGVLGAHTLQRRIFTEDDAQFLQSMANVLSGAIQRNSAEQALRESEQLARRRLFELESLYETAPVGLGFVDPDLRFARCNTRLAGFIGRPVPELIGRTLRAVLPRMAETMDPIYRKVIDSGAGLESMELRASGAADRKSPRDWLASFYPVQHDGANLGISVVVQDITERKRMEAKLRKNEAILARAQRIAHLGSWEMEFFNPANIDECEMHWSDEVYRILGYAPGEIPVTRATLCKAVHPGDRPAISGALARVLQERKPCMLEYSIVRPDGSQRMVRSQLEVVFNQDGRLMGLAGTLQDITEARMIDEAIRESQRFLQSVLDATPSEIAILDDSSDIIAVNQAWRRFGDAHGFRAPDHGVGMNYLRACHSATGVGSTKAQLVAEALQEIISGKRQNFFLEYSCHSPETKRWFMVRFSRFFTAGAVRIVSVHEDVTQLKLAQEDLQEAKDQLSIYAKELENKVEERTTNLRDSYRSLEGVLYHVAHDLRAPLRATEGLISLLMQNYGQTFDSPGRDFAQRIAAAATRMDRLIQDLLEYGRVAQIDVPITVTELEPHLNNVLEQLAEAVRAKSAEVDVDRPLPAVRANPTLLDQVLRNLLDNALKFVRPGFTPRIHIRAEEKMNAVQVTMEDNCVEIEPENQERIFRVFERLNQESPPSGTAGTGIGLAIVSKAMERMNGSAGVQPRPGQGNRFWLEFPAVGKKENFFKPTLPPQFYRNSPPFTA
jgi:PAS domain S-box-containing protein